MILILVENRHDDYCLVQKCVCCKMKSAIFGVKCPLSNKYNMFNTFEILRVIIGHLASVVV